MGNNTPKKIRESREKILLLMEKGYNQLDIAKELQITRMTINRDMHYINEMTNKGVFEMAKTSFATMYSNCNDGFNEIQKEYWKIYCNVDNDPNITPVVKLAALKLAAEIHDKEFSMFKDGPTVMDLRRLHEKVDDLKRVAFEERNTFGTRFLPRRDIDINDLDKR
jgi:hypothetical protein